MAVTLRYNPLLAMWNIHVFFFRRKCSMMFPTNKNLHMSCRRKPEDHLRLPVNSRRKHKAGMTPWKLVTMVEFPSPLCGEPSSKAVKSQKLKWNNLNFSDTRFFDIQNMILAYILISKNIAWDLQNLQFLEQGPYFNSSRTRCQKGGALWM